MIVTARKLAYASPTRPRQAELKRAISTACYALFQALARDAANLLVGSDTKHPDKAWVHVYRSLQHGDARNACEAIRNSGLPASITACAKAFITLQLMRHDADYDPEFRASRGDASDAIEMAEKAITSLKSAARADRNALVVRLLLKRRR